MSAESAVLAGRAAAEALMVDTCTITRADGTETTDPGTGIVTPGGSTIYTGPCRVQVRALVAQSPEAGEVQLSVGQVEMQIPMAVTGVRTGDVATILTAALDPDLVGRRFRVSVPAHKTHATARRLSCTEGGSGG